MNYDYNLKKGWHFRDSKIDGWIDRYIQIIDIWMDSCIDIWIDSCINIWIDRCIDGQLDGQLV